MDVLGHIKDLLNERGMSVYELSKKSGVPKSTLTSMFSKSTNPTFATLELICVGLKITMAEFFSSGKPLDELTYEETQLLEKWHALSDEKKKSLFELLKHY